MHASIQSAFTALGPIKVDLAPNFLAADTAAKAAAAAAAGAGAGGGNGGAGAGFLGGLAAKHFNLFGGAASGGFMAKLPALLTGVTGLHLAVDGAAEALAVMIPSTIALGIFAAAAAGPVQGLYKQLQTINTVSTATGHAIPPLSGGLTKLQAAAKPAVWQIYGDALSVMSSKAGTLQNVVQGTGQVLDQLGARAALALSGHGMGALLANYKTDLADLGSLGGNLLGVLGNLLHVMPGAAESLLRVADDVSLGIERLTGSRPVQDILSGALAGHAALLWGGLAATLGGRVMTGALTGISNLALTGAVRLEKMGAAGARASEGLLGVASGAETAASMPWGVIAGAAIGVGLLADALITAKDATGQWISSQQKALAALPAGTGSSQFGVDQAVNLNMLSAAQHHFNATLRAAKPAADVAGAGAIGFALAVAGASSDVQQLKGNQQQLSAQQILYNQRLGILAKTYGGTAQASGMLVASGITMGQFLAKGSQQWLQVKQEVYATSLAYQTMHQTGGRLGADMAILNYQASTQTQDMQKLTQAWSAYLGAANQLQTGEIGVIQNMATLRTDMKATGASFTGINSASLTLQQTFAQQITSITGVVTGLMNANAPAKTLAGVLAHDVYPAVKDGALANRGFRQSIYDLAVQAGYAGQDKIGPLTAFIDKNNISTRRALGLTNRWAASLEKLPSKVPVTIELGLTGNPAAINALLGQGVNKGAIMHIRPLGANAKGTLNWRGGLTWVGENGPEIVNLPRGAQVYPAQVSKALSAAMRGGIQAPAGADHSMTVNNTFNGFGTQGLVGIVQQAMTASSVQHGRKLRIGRAR